jgi:beta-lactamase regulating signal transducer with metallopeptidase domain
MTYGWLAHVVVGGGLLLLLAWALTRCTRQPARRQKLGEWGIAAALLLPLLSLAPAWLEIPLAFLPSPTAANREPVRAPVHECATGEGVDAGPAAGSPEEAPGVEAVEGVAGDEADLPAPTADALAPTEEPTLPAVAAPSRPAPADTGSVAVAPTFSPAVVAEWLGAAYALGAVLLIGRWLLGHLALRHLVRAAVPAPEPVARLFAEMTAGLGRRPRLVVSPRLTVPVSCGLRRPTVILPTTFCRPHSSAWLCWVFAHELTHLERRDAWACLLFGLGQAVYYFLPWFWWLRRQVRLCQEFIADAAAAGQGGRAEDYAQFLLSLTGPRAPVGATGVLGNSSDLFRRVTMLLQNPIPLELRCPRRWSLAAAGVLLAVAVLAAGIGLGAAPAPGLAAEGGQTAQAEKDYQIAEFYRRTGHPESASLHYEIVRRRYPGTPVADQATGRVNELRAQAPRQGEDPFTAPPGSENGPAEREEPARPEKPREAGRQALGREPDFRALEQAIDELRKSGASPEEIQILTNAIQKLRQQRETRRMLELRRALVEQRDRAVVAFVGQPGEGRLGVAVQPPGQALVDQLDLPKGEGLVIIEVRPGSAAEKAGLKVNDILLEVGGSHVPNDVGAFVRQLGEVKSETPVEVLLVRKGKKETVKGLSLPATRAAVPVRARVITVPQPGAPVLLRQSQAIAAGSGVMTTVFRTEDRFTTRYQEGALFITVTGKVANGKAKVGEITVQDGAASTDYPNLDKVPERYRDKVKNLVEMSEKGSAKIEINTPRKGRQPDNLRRPDGEVEIEFERRPQ